MNKWLCLSHYVECLTVPTMTWLTVMENICLTNDNGFVPFVVISSFMTCYRVCTNGNTTGATDGEGTSYLPEHLSSLCVATCTPANCNELPLNFKTIQRICSLTRASPKHRHVGVSDPSQDLDFHWA